MTAVSGTIPNLIGGMSQQPYVARLENTSSQMKNAVPSVVSGLQKRPPIQYIGKLLDNPTSSTAFFLLDRPNKDTKFITVADGELRVFNEDGTEETVTTTETAENYLESASDPERDIGFVSIGDTIYVYNRQVTVGSITTVESRPNPDYYVTFVIEQAVANNDYSIEVNGISGTYSVDSTPSGVAAIATGLAASWNTASGGTYGTATVFGNTIVIALPSELSTDFTGSPEGYVYSYHKEVQLFTNLPAYEADGRIVKVVGDPGDSASNYWVQYDGDTHLWNEVAGYGCVEYPTAWTMPMWLVDNDDGTWTFQETSWGHRESGDDDSNPSPSFIGYTIENMFFTSGRMIILADENFIASEVGEYENFYRTTCTTLLDSDRLDAAALTSDNRVAKLYHCTEFDGGLLLFSDKSQFWMSVDSGLSPNTINLKETTSYSCSTNVRPVKIGSELLFVDEVDNSYYVDMREYKIDGVTGVATSDVVTKQVPEFILSDMVRLVSNSTLGIALCFNRTMRSRIYVYSYYTANGERLQSAWSFWHDDDVSFLYGGFIGTRLYITYSDDYGVHLGFIDMRETVDGDFDGVKVTLDYRTDDFSSITYNSETNGTTVVMPYGAHEGAQYTAVIMEDGTYPAGSVFNVSAATGYGFFIPDVDLSSETFIIGKRYGFEWIPSPVILRDNQNVPVQDGRLQLRYLSFLYHKSSYFTVTVEYPDRDSVTQTFTGRTMGDYTNVFGEVAVSDGEFSVACPGQPTQMTIRVENDSPFACNFSSIEWRGSWRARTKRI